MQGLAFELCYASECPIGLEQGHPPDSLPQQMASPAATDLSTACTVAGAGGWLPKPKPAKFCSSHPGTDLQGVTLAYVINRMGG